MSVNVGYGPQTYEDVIRIATRFADRIREIEGLNPAHSLKDVQTAHESATVAVAFDLEDSGPLDGNLDRVAEFHELGVRTLGFAYNRANRAGGGCLDPNDTGLTTYGLALVAELNAAGIVVDGSHCGRLTGRQLTEASSAPMVYSHSCAQSLVDHPRNITDDQARICAERGGVIGVAGVRHLLGAEGNLMDAMVAHIDYFVDLVGIDHVGVATDYVFDFDELAEDLASAPGGYPFQGPPRTARSYMEPEMLRTLPQVLRAHGYKDEHITAIAGGNFARIAAQAWR